MGTSSIGIMDNNLLNATSAPILELSSSIFISNLTNSSLNMEQNKSLFNYSGDPYPYCDTIKDILTFDTLALVRVSVCTACFIVSLLGNLFVLSCVIKKSRTSHIYLIMLHLTLADLAFTFFSMTQDVIWGITIMWMAGDFMCRLCQVLRAIGMYISAFMVVVTAFDRCFSIVLPLTVPMTQRQRTRIMLVVAWVMSIICAIPAGVMFSVVRLRMCPIEEMEEEFVQCIDFNNRDEAQVRKYNFYGMFLTFVFPLICIIISYGLVICEISKMAQRDRALMQRRDSNNSLTILRARRKTLILTSMVTGTFLLLWGPFYVLGIYQWFNHEWAKQNSNKGLSTFVFLLMSFHPAIHPILYGVWIREVRDKFWKCLYSIERFITCHKSSLEVSNQHPPHTCCIKSGRRRRSCEKSLVLAGTADTNNLNNIIVRTAKSEAYEHQSLINSIPPDKTKRNQSLPVNGNNRVHWPDNPPSKEDVSRQLDDSGIGR